MNTPTTTSPAPSARSPAAATPTTLTPTPLIDSDHPDVIGFSREHARGSTPLEQAISLYYAVRDGFRYDPYRIDLSPDGIRASSVIAKGYGWCVPKAALLAAASRAAGIPARVGYADVRNHLSTARMREMISDGLYIWHGYTDLLLEDRWVKATPAFNIELCQRFGLLPLEFDGRSDSIHHPFDASGQRHMEYVNQRGAFDEVPLDRIRSDFELAYPRWLAASAEMAKANFQADVDKESAEG